MAEKSTGKMRYGGKEPFFTDSEYVHQFDSKLLSYKEFVFTLRFNVIDVLTLAVSERSPYIE